MNRLKKLHWTSVAPIAGLVGLAVMWGRYDLPAVVEVVAGVLLAASVLAAVHHAEVIAHKVGEPFGSLILALAVTVIEVGMIVMLMTAGGEGAETLARDTVFSAVMITTNLIVGLALFVAAGKGTTAHFQAVGSGPALATVLVLATMTMVLPSFTTSAPEGVFSGSQLAFAAVMSLVVWGLFVLTQTTRHRDFFLPVDELGKLLPEDHHAGAPSRSKALTSLGLLLASLVGVVGLAKVLSPTVEHAVEAAGLPHAFVGVVIALLVLLPETLAAVNNARRGRTQVALNLGYGSAIASIGLTIPAVGLISTVMHLPLVLGLEPVHLALLTLTGFVSVLTLLHGRATRLEGSLHLVLALSFLFLAAVP